MLRLKELRLNSGITQKQLANHLRIAQNTLSYWENGKYEPDSENLTAIADYFDVSVDYLLGKTDIKKAPVESDKGNRPAMEREFMELFELLPAEKRKTIVAVMKSLLTDKE